MRLNSKYISSVFLCIVGIFQVNMKEVNTQKSKLNHCLKPLLALLISLSNNIVVFLKFRMETESNEMDLYPSQIYACLMPSSSWRNTFFFSFSPAAFTGISVSAKKEKIHHLFLPFPMCHESSLSIF